MSTARSIDTTPAVPTFKCWSRDWWAVLLSRIERGESIQFMVHYARQPGRHGYTESAEHMPSPELIAMLKSYPSDGVAMKAWRPWFEQRGVHLPLWTRRVWVFLPAPSPPPAGQSVWQASQDAA